MITHDQKCKVIQQTAEQEEAAAVQFAEINEQKAAIKVL
jgi:hypothetical protein